MATYAEIYNLRNDSALRNRVAAAALKKAQAFLDLATPTAAQVAWSKAALADPGAIADDLLGYVLAANSASSVAQIQSANDATIQTNVNAAADKLAT